MQRASNARPRGLIARTRAIPVVAFSLALPFVTSFRPVTEADSIAQSSALFMIGQGLTSPLDAPGITLFWEAGYLPLIALTGSTVFPTSAQCITSLASYALSREVGLSTLHAQLVTATGCFSGFLWGL